MGQWKKKAIIKVKVTWFKLWMKAMSPFTTTKGFQNAFFVAIATGVAFAGIRMIQSFSGSPLNNSRGYAALSLICPIIIVALGGWVAKRQSVKGAALSAHESSERAHKSMEAALAERERDELGKVLAEHLGALAEEKKANALASGEAVEEVAPEEPRRRLRL